MPAPRPLEVPPPSSTLQHLSANVTFWRQQRARLETDRRNLVYLLYAALPVAFAVQFVSKMPIAALAAGGALLSAWGLGLYMVTVRRAEYDFATAEAEKELRAAQAPGPESAGHPFS